MKNNKNYNIALDFIKVVKSLGKEAFIVGGLPRDILLDQDSNDIDICTNMNDEMISENFHVLKSNCQFLSYILEYKGFRIELTHYREDTYKGNRFPKVRQISNIEKDILRRDFTINCIYIDYLETFHFPLSSKLDINKKKIKTVKDANISFNEDPVRIIRAVYYSVKLGFDIEEETLNAMELNHSLIDQLSKNRIQNELIKIKKVKNFEKNMYFKKFLVKYI